MDFYRNLVLTDNDTISNGIEECSISQFIDLIKDNDFNDYGLKYNKGQKRFVYTAEGQSYSLKLTKARKELIEEGINDPVLQRLIDFADVCQEIKKGKKANERFLETGEYPTDLEGLESYKKYFERELSKTKAYIVKSGIYSTITMGCFAGFVGSIASLMNNMVSRGEPPIYWPLVVFPISLLVFGISFVAVEEIPILCLIDHISNYNSYKERIKKIEEISKSVVSKVEANEVQTATKFKDLFIQEAHNVSGLIAKLPVEERKEFLIVLQDLLNEYRDEIKKISESDEINLGVATSIWDLTSRMLPKIYRLKIDIESKVDDDMQKEQVISEINQMQLSLDSLNSDNEYEIDNIDYSIPAGDVNMVQKKC